MLKLSGAVPKEAMKTLTVLILNFTLPCALIRSLHGITVSASLLWILLLGFAGNCILLLVARLVRPKRDAADTAGRTAMLNLPGYNIGLFAMPYTATFLSPEGFLALCFFDAGNSIMCTGGTYALVCRDASQPLGQQLHDMALRIVTSVPLMTYMVLVVLAALEIDIPRAVLPFVNTCAQANSFLAMIMIGLSINLKIRLEALKDFFSLLAWRHLVNGLLAVFSWYWLPFPEEVRLAIVLLLCAPMPAMGLIFTMKARLDVSWAANINTLSILISVVVMSTLITLLV